MPALYETLTQPWLLVSATAIVAFTLGLWVDAFLRFKEKEARLEQAGDTAKKLADEAADLSKKLHECLGQFQSRPPTHPNFHKNDDHDTDGWWRYNHEQRERVMTRYFEQHATEVWRVIEGAKHFIPIDRNEIWHVSHMSSDHDVAEMARLMASIAARLRLVVSGDLPIPGETIANPRGRHSHQEPQSKQA